MTLRCRSFLLLLLVLSLVASSINASSIISSSGITSSSSSSLSFVPRSRTLPPSSQPLSPRGLQSLAMSSDYSAPSSKSAAAVVSSPAVSGAVSSDTLKLLFGAGGIYASFLMFGYLSEEILSTKGGYTCPHEGALFGTQFKSVWFLQFVEALANVVIGFVGMKLSKVAAGKFVDHKGFATSGFTQVSAKALTSLSLANGLSFPVQTLAKSGKMIPVMLGSIFVGGAKYTNREYLQVLAIVAGTVLVGLESGKGKAGKSSSTLGVACIMGSLICDGLTGGLQNKMKSDAKAAKRESPQGFEMMFYTNLYMSLCALAVALCLGELSSGPAYLLANMATTEDVSGASASRLAFLAKAGLSVVDNQVHHEGVVMKVLLYALCSAMGQSFIFYVISNFDPLKATTITTTRKIFSVLLSVFTKGHADGFGIQSWAGLSVACSGILAEMLNKKDHGKGPAHKKAGGGGGDKSS